jgi:hypothetical protein
MEIGAIIKLLLISLLMSAVGIKLIYDWLNRDIPQLFKTLGMPPALILIAGVTLQAPAIFLVFSVFNSQGFN